MKRGALIVLLAAALGAGGVDDTWARGGGKSGRSGSSGRGCSTSHSHSHPSVRAPTIVSSATHGGYYPGYYSPAMPGATQYQYYCPDSDRYYPEVLECPSGFRAVT